jgi:hypothetical protein
MDGKERDSKQSSRVGPSQPGVISVFELYTIDEARRRLRWTDSAFRAAKRRGLRILRSGKRHFVTGRELFRFLQADSRSCSDALPGEAPD